MKILNKKEVFVIGEKVIPYEIFYSLVDIRRKEIKEIDEIMPKDNKFREEENYYLNYAIIQFLKRNR